MASDMDGDSADGRWLTYAELAEIRGITTRSATRMAFRAKWRRQMANDGTTRVFVPQSALHGKPSGSDTSKAMADMAATMGRLQEELERAGARTDQAEARADRAEARADALRERLEALLVEQRLEADHARRQVQEAQEAAEALRAELAADRARADQADAALREAQERLDELARTAQARLLRGRLARLLPWRRVEW